VRLTTALVVSGGGLQGLSLIKSMAELPAVRVLVADCYEENVARFEVHGYFQAPLLANPEAFAGFLRRLCRDESVDHLFPTTDLELDILAREREALETAGTRVWVSSADLLAVARDKVSLAHWLRSHDLPCLPTSETPEALAVEGPVLGKPRAGFGGRGIVRMASCAEAAALSAAQREGLAWQPYIAEFDEYSIDFSVAGPGRVSPAYLRRRIRTSGGYAVVCEPGADALVTQIAERAIHVLSLSGALGMMNLQILVSAGEAWVSDLNARAGMSLPLTLAAGGNPLGLLLGAEPRAQTTGPAVRTVRTLREHMLVRPPLAGVRGVVFDLDDTLLDQKHWIAAKLRLTWQQERDWLEPEHAFLSATLAVLEEGERARLFDVYAARRGLGEEQRLRLIEAFRGARPPEGRIYPDAPGTLAQLRRRGLRLALLTDNPPASQRMKLECTQLAPAFDAVVLTGELGTPKPARAAFAAAAQQLDLRPDELVMVGDHIFRDTIGALDAGYAHAFHIQRAGGFFNFDLALCSPLLLAGRWTRLNTLHELDWYLRTESPS